MFFSKCFRTDDELADDSSIAKTGFFIDLRLFCACASGTNNSNNETKFERRWTNTFIRIFDLFVSPLLFSLYFQLCRLFPKSLCTPLRQITVFWRLSTTNSNTFIPGAENSHEVKTDLHLRRPKFLRLPAGFRKPFQLTETRGFADHFLKISRSFSSGNLNCSNFPARSRLVSYDVLHHRQHAVVHVSAIAHLLPGYRGTYNWGVCTFGALQSTAILQYCKRRNIRRRKISYCSVENLSYGI